MTFKHKLKRKLCLCTCLALTLFISACYDDNNNAAAKPAPDKIITVNAKATVTTLNYNGVLDPISSAPVLSPIDGTVTQMHFGYGAAVKQGEPLLTLDSSSLEKDYRSQIKAYLAAKQTVTSSAQDYKVNKALFAAGATPKQTLDESKVTLDNAQIALIQAKLDLSKTLSKTNIDINNITKLSVTDTDQVNKLLSKKFENIIVKAPASGIALFPVAQDGNSSGDNKPVDIGAQVKSGGLLVSIGDLSGLSTSATVSEININRIKPGQKVIITGDAFPTLKLNGFVKTVDSQAQQGDSMSGNISLFKITIAIPNISPLARKTIHIGMTASISIPIKNPAHIIVPFAAVKEINGKSNVTVVSATGQQTIPVITGETTPTGVSILHGLKDGDKIVVPAKQ